MTGIESWFHRILICWRCLGEAWVGVQQSAALVIQLGPLVPWYKAWWPKGVVY